MPSRTISPELFPQERLPNIHNLIATGVARLALENQFKQPSNVDQIHDQDPLEKFRKQNASGAAVDVEVITNGSSMDNIIESIQTGSVFFLPFILDVFTRSSYKENSKYEVVQKSGDLVVLKLPDGVMRMISLNYLVQQIYQTANISKPYFE